MEILINIISQMFHFSKKSLIISRMRGDPKLSEKKQSVNPKTKAAEKTGIQRGRRRKQIPKERETCGMKDSEGFPISCPSIS